MRSFSLQSLLEHIPHTPCREDCPPKFVDDVRFQRILSAYFVFCLYLVLHKKIYIKSRQQTRARLPKNNRLSEKDGHNCIRQDSSNRQQHGLQGAHIVRLMPDANQDEFGQARYSPVFHRTCKGAACPTGSQQHQGRCTAGSSQQRLPSMLRDTLEQCSSALQQSIRAV